MHCLRDGSSNILLIIRIGPEGGLEESIILFCNYSQLQSCPRYDQKKRLQTKDNLNFNVLGAAPSQRNDTLLAVTRFKLFAFAFFYFFTCCDECLCDECRTIQICPYGHMDICEKIWSSGVSPKKASKMQLRNVDLRSVGHSSQKLWPKTFFSEKS